MAHHSKVKLPSPDYDVAIFGLAAALHNMIIVTTVKGPLAETDVITLCTIAVRLLNIPPVRLRKKGYIAHNLY